MPSPQPQSSRPAPKKPKRSALSLKDKVAVIKAFQDQPKASLRQLAEKFSCGRTQISKILKRKAGGR